MNEIGERARRLQREAEEFKHQQAELADAFYPFPLPSSVATPTAVEVTLRLHAAIEKLGRALDPAVQNWVTETSRCLVAELRKKHPEWSWYTGAPTLDEYLRRVRWRRLDVERWQGAR